MSKVSFVLINSKREVSAIRAKVVYNGVQYTYNPHVSIDVHLFNKGRCRASQEAGSINNKLDAVEAAIMNTIIYFNRSFTTPSQDQFKEKVERFLAGDNAIQINRKDQDLLTYIDKFIKDSGMSLETKKGYTTARNKIAEFQAGKKSLTFNDITFSFEKQFNRWLIKNNYSRNYIGTIIKNLKRFMKEADRVDKLHTNRDYEEFVVDAETADTIFLTMKELEKIHKLEFTDKIIAKYYVEARPVNVETIRQSLEAVRKKFLIGAVCAMRVSDYSRILDVDKNNNFITIIPKKGASLRKPEPIKMPIHKIFKDIIDSGFDISTPVADFMINRQIKTICQMVDINDMIVCHTTKGGKLVEDSKPKWEWVTSHTARRSGATNMYLSGVPLRLIRVCTGHKSDEMLLKYIKAAISDNLEELRKFKYFK